MFLEKYNSRATCCKQNIVNGTEMHFQTQREGNKVVAGNVSL